MKLISLTVLMALVLSGCATKVRYKEVLVPQKCEVSTKTRPLYTKNVVRDFKNVLIYTELLEQDIKICKGGKNE